MILEQLSVAKMCYVSNTGRGNRDSFVDPGPTRGP